MQIFPTIQTGTNPAAFFSSSSNDSGFFEAMNEALQSVDEGDAHSATAAMNEGVAPVVESPYSRHTADGVTYTLSEVCFSKSELKELRDALVKEGCPAQALKQFDILADQPDGATLAQVLASLAGKSAQIQLSDGDIHEITALLGQLDPSGTLSQDVIGAMQEGNTMLAFDLIQDALGGMAADEAIDVDLGGLVALGKGLGLNEGTLNSMASSFGARSSLTLNPAQFDALLKPAKSQLLEEAAQAEKLDAALEKTLKPILAKARNRMEKEKAASELQERRVEQSKVLIDKTVRENASATMDETLAGENRDTAASDVISRELNGAQAATVGQAGHEDGVVQADKKNARQTLAAKDAQQAENDKFYMRQFVEHETSTKDFSGFGQDKGRDGGQHDKSDPWRSLLDKVETRATSTISNNLNASSVVYSILQGNLVDEQAFEANMLLRDEAQLTARLARQVENGVLTAMRDGSTRLELQLHPAELGTITITLIARNGEITAQLRSEKSETAEVLARQMETMRVNLEQQGVKVDKIEVQLENRQQDMAQNSFDDLGRHNARQEENARRQELNRLRNLASMRNSLINEEEPVLAQSLHNIAQTAGYAGQPLHVIA